MFVTPHTKCTDRVKQHCSKHTLCLQHRTQNVQRQDQMRDSIRNALNAVTEDQIREFLAEEMENNKELLERFTVVFGARRGPRTDYRTMAESIYGEYTTGRYDLIPYGTDIDFDRITRLASAHEKKKDYEEAIRAYRELSEVIAKNMDMVDDSDGYYGMYFSDSIDGMVKCINKPGVIKQRHIKYMFEKFMLKEPDYFADDYEDALGKICTTANDLAYWEKLLDLHIPDTLPDNDDTYWSGKYDAARLIMMKITILERTGSPALTDILAKHYRNDHNICTAYIAHLKKKDKQAAMRIAEEGAKLFPQIKEIRDILHGMYKKTDPRYAKSLRRIFLQDGSWNHYDKLKKISGDWDGELKSIIKELRREGNHYMLIEIFLREHMIDMAKKLILQCDDLYILEEYHDNVCKLYPEKYHAAYRKHIDSIAKGVHGRSSYRDVKEHLKMMKTVPGHKKEFKEFVEYLRERHARQPAFLDELKRL